MLKEIGRFKPTCCKTAILFILCVFILAALIGCSSTQTSSRTGLAISAWPKFGGDIRNTSLGKKRAMTWKVKWTSPKLGAMDASPVIGPDGTIYAATRTGNIYSLDGKTGKVNWSSPTWDNKLVRWFKSTTSRQDYSWLKPLNKKSRVFGSSMSSPALSADGILYIGSRDGYMYAFNAKTGYRKWRFCARDSTIESSPSSPTIGSDGTVYFENGSSFYAIDGHNGNLKWKYDSNGSVEGSPIIGSNGTVYMASLCGIYAFELHTGTLKWQIKQQVSSELALGRDDTIYAGLWDGGFLAVDGITGVIKWQSMINLPLNSKHPDQIMKCPAIGPDGTVYANTQNNVLYAWDSATGKIMWKRQCDFYGYPAVTSDGIIYLNTCSSAPGGKIDSKICALDAKTGKTRRDFTYETSKGGINSPLAIAKDGTIFVCGYIEKLYAIH